MKVWLLAITEILPTDAGNQRQFRGGTLAKMLAAQGHQVTWWASSTNHFTKTMRVKEDTDIALEPNLKLKILRAPHYTRNISVRRMIHHSWIAKKFKRLALKEEKPDIIISFLPIIELCSEACDFGKKYNIPVVIDIKDMWPDIFLDLAPRFLRPLAKFLLKPLYKKLYNSIDKATALFGITDGAIKWALSHSTRKRSSYDKAFHLAYSQVDPTPEEQKEANSFWDHLGVSNENKFNVIYIGNLNKRCDLSIMVEAARLTPPHLKDKIQFIFCGRGEGEKRLQELSKDIPNIIMVGWVDKPSIWTLLRRVNLGIIPYPNSFDFQLSIPNKVIEYWSTGLPVVSTIFGELSSFIEKNHVGLTSERTPEDLMKKIVDLYENSDLRQEMSKNALTVFNDFSAEKVYSAYINQLKLIVESQKNLKNRI
jgi:glycosyltransferase involved in cell wall biosynthesis